MLLLITWSGKSSAEKTLDLNKSQVEILADLVKDNELCEARLKNRTASLGQCRTDLAEAEKVSFYQEPGFVVGGFIVSFSLGALLMGTQCFGMCK